MAGVASRLHWFRGEAAWTWITGVLLLVFVYHHGGLLVDAGSNVRPAVASIAGFAALLGGGVIYDAIWQSPLGPREPLAGAVCFVLVVAPAWGVTPVMCGRSAYIHAGGMSCPIMT